MEKKHKLKEIPSAWIHNNKKCQNCNYGHLYTVRARFRIGKKEEVINDKYGSTTTTKRQLNIIVGDICTDCGAFTEDQDFKAARIVTLKKQSKGDSYFKEHYKKLLTKAKKD